MVTPCLWDPSWLAAGQQASAQDPAKRTSRRNRTRAERQAQSVKAGPFPWIRQIQVPPGCLKWVKGSRGPLGTPCPSGPKLCTEAVTVKASQDGRSVLLTHLVKDNDLEVGEMTCEDPIVSKTRHHPDAYDGPGYRVIEEYGWTQVWKATRSTTLPFVVARMSLVKVNISMPKGAASVEEWLTSMGGPALKWGGKVEFQAKGIVPQQKQGFKSCWLLRHPFGVDRADAVAKGQDRLEPPHESNTEA